MPSGKGTLRNPLQKDLIARKACTITMSKAWGIHWNVNKCEEHLGIVLELS